MLLLRGINVGGKHKLPMKALAELVTELGGSEVRTLIQSGNVVLRASAAVARRLPQTLPPAIEAAFGFAPPVILRSAAQLQKAIEQNPFLAEGVDPDKLHLTFCATTPDPTLVAAIDRTRFLPDRFALIDDELYLHTPDGLGRSKIGTFNFDRALKTTCTTRNWRTVSKLLALTESL